jgi:outer membrane lipoprotein-sorting protein
LKIIIHNIPGKIKLLIFFAIGLVLHSCTSGTSVDKNMTIAEIKKRVNTNSNRITSVDADGNIFFETPEETNSAFMTLSIHKPDSLYAKFQGPFGITAGNVLVTRDNFIYFNALDNIVIKGPSSPLNLGAVLRIRVNFDDLIKGLSGSMGFSDETDKNSSLSIIENEYIITITESDITKRYRIDPSGFFITNYLEYSSSVNNPSLEIKYSNFIESNGRNFPKKIEINRPDASQFVSIDLRDYQMNKNKLTFKIVIPNNAKIIEWD